MRDRKMRQSVEKEGGELSVYSLVLAAGSANRFGALKQLARLNGQSLLQRALRLAGQVSGPNTVLVVGAQWLRVVDAGGRLNPFIVRNENFASGIGSSIAVGIRAIRPLADAALILLADQPLITAEHLFLLQKEWRASPASIVATGFAEIVGPPAIFPANYFDQLLLLRGDAGARSIIVEHDDALISVPFADAAVDIDTPEDLQRL
jgi:molybdenum cofactor cytidylyltransferase